MYPKFFLSLNITAGPFASDGVKLHCIILDSTSPNVQNEYLLTMTLFSRIEKNTLGAKSREYVLPICIGPFSSDCVELPSIILASASPIVQNVSLLMPTLFLRKGKNHMVLNQKNLENDMYSVVLTD